MTVRLSPFILRVAVTIVILFSALSATAEPATSRLLRSFEGKFNNDVRFEFSQYVVSYDAPYGRVDNQTIYVFTSHEQKFGLGTTTRIYSATSQTQMHSDGTRYKFDLKSMSELNYRDYSGAVEALRGKAGRIFGPAGTANAYIEVNFAPNKRIYKSIEITDPLADGKIQSIKYLMPGYGGYASTSFSPVHSNSVKPTFRPKSFAREQFRKGIQFCMNLFR